MKTYRPYQPDQPLLLPVSLHDYLPEDDLASFVPEVVAALDLSAILAVYEREPRGYPPYHPHLLVGLLLYAYARGIYSSRRIAFGCTHDIGFMVVAARQTPDFRTIASFRKRHLEPLATLFQQVLQLAAEVGLVKLGHVALDGTKARANASRHKAMSYGRMEERATALEAEVANWLQQAEAADAAEDATLATGRAMRCRRTWPPGSSGRPQFARRRPPWNTGHRSKPRRRDASRSKRWYRPRPNTTSLTPNRAS